MINRQDKYNNTPLWYAVANKYVKMVEILLNRGAKEKINAKCGGKIKKFKSLNEQKTVLHKACENGNVEIVKLLLENGADFRIHDKDLRTPLAYASAEIKEVCFLKHEVSHVLTLKDFRDIKKRVISIPHENFQSMA